MDRDRRLTGYLRGQTDNPAAPPGFELNNPWRVCSLHKIGLFLETITDSLLYSWRSVSFREWRFLELYICLGEENQ
jgi:hypothetical protein